MARNKSRYADTLPLVEVIRRETIRAPENGLAGSTREYLECGHTADVPDYVRERARRRCAQCGPR